ncbi:hypothetical protein V8C86DRAFT_3193426 [Haematococcus lacustris]
MRVGACMHAAGMTAGQWAAFTVQLRDVLGQPASAAYDPQLTITCQARSAAALAANGSWCAAAPLIRPLGGGQYTVQVMLGSLWWQPPPPVLGELAMPLPPLDQVTAQGDNWLAVQYAGHHLPGSPVRVTGAAEPVLDVTQSYMVQSVELSTTNNTTAPVLLQSWRLVDRFGNWLPLTSFTSQLQAG